MGDKDDFTMDAILKQLGETPGYEHIVDTMKVSSLQSPKGNVNGNGSIIRRITEALKDSPVNQTGTYTTLTQSTEAGLHDLKKVQLHELCSFVDADVDIDSTGGRYLVDLYHGYQLMIKRIIERHPKGNYTDPAGYPEREIFDSITGIIEEEDTDAIIFDLTGEDEIEGGLETIATKIFKNLNKRFLEKSGWKEKDSPVSIIDDRAFKTIAPFDASGSMQTFPDLSDILIQRIKDF